MSKLKLYSIGIVTKDKERSSRTISVLPIEELPLANGDLTATIDMASDYIENEQHSTTSTTKSYVLEAIWLPLGVSNRALPPDVMKNETVLIYSYGNTGKYYWTTAMNEPTLRRQETTVFLVGNEPEEGVPLGKDNSHWLLMSSHDKKVILHTSENNGEQCGYDLTMDLERGLFTLIDTVGNSIYLRSPEGELEANIKEKTTINSPIIETNGKDVTINVSNDAIINASNSVNVNADSSIVCVTNDCTITAPTMTLNGDVTNNGSMTVTGGITTPGGISTSSSPPSTGEAAISGNLSVTGNSALADVTADNITASGTVSGSSGNFPNLN